MSSRFWICLGFLCLLDAGANLPFLRTTTIAQIDEARIAEVAREMVAGKDWLVPRIGGHPFASYPPLGYWLIALSGLVLGFNEFSVRLPSALAGIALVAVAGTIARRLAGDRAGLWSAAILATTPTFYLLQSSARADVIVTLFAAIAFERFLAVADGARGWRPLTGFYGALAAGVLTKGPLGLVIPALGIAGWLALRRRGRILLDLKPWWGGLALLALVLPWFLAIARHPECGPNFLRVTLLLENVRAFTDGFEQGQPLWFYAERGLPRLLPWLLVSIFVWRVRRTPGLSVALLWAALVFLFLHLSSSKRASYFTYLSPAFAVTTGIILAALDEGTVRRALFVVAGSVAVAAIAMPFLPIRWDLGWPVQDLVLPFALGTGAGAAALAFLTWRRGGDAGLAALTILLLACVVVHLAVLGPRMDAEGRRWRDFVRRARATAADVGTPDPIALEPCLHFYFERALPRRDGPPGTYVVYESQRASLLGRGLPVRILDEVRDDRNRPIYLLQVLP